MATTLYMGQDFRWYERDDGWHSGVLSGNLIHMRRTERGVEYKSDSGSNLDCLLHSYFRLGDSIEAIYADISRDDLVAMLVEKYHGLRLLSPNPPKDTDGRREDRGRGVRELQGGWPGLHYWGRWEVSGRSSAAAQGPYGRLRELGCGDWRENTQQGTLADRDDASLRGRWVSCRLGVEWLAAGPRRD